ncbi:MAG: penicillin-binding protein 2, partial [Mucispirillum sp.]|nr:penicillin-binding protein 2 [Mucispirillum sp.]
SLSVLFAALKDNLLNYYKRRIILGFVFFTLFTVILFIRLFILQVIEYEDLVVVADSNRTAKRDVIADRGFIYDRNMNILVSNTPTYDLVLNKDDIKKGENINELLRRVNEVVDFDMDTVKKDIADRNIKSVLISRGLTLSDIAYFEEYADDFIGLSVEFHSVRKYADGLAYSHILGYVREVTPEMIKRNKGIYKQGSVAGIIGVESQYENELRGTNGVRYIERDARGRTVNILSEQPAVAGKDIILTIDSELQKHIVELMKDKKGAAVVLDISDNSVLSLYSAPSYDLNMFTPYLNEQEWKLIHQDKRTPLVNRPIEGLFSPGSVYKVAMALAGLEENAVDRSTSFNCSGTFYLNSTFSYRCWKRTGHGKVNLRRALAESCDVYFYNLGLQLDIDKMEYYSKILSLG